MRARSLLIGIVAASALSGCKGKQPSNVEASLIWAWKHHLSVGGKKQINPVKATPQTIANGQQEFSHYCVACHGLDGQNTGVPFAAHMSPPVPSLASKNVQQYTDGQLKWIIENGIWPSGMPGSKGTWSNDEIWSIVNYIRHLPKAGSLGDPSMYSQ